MKKSRLTAEQVTGIPQESEAEAQCADLCRKHGLSRGTLCNCKAKFGGMSVSKAKRLQVFEAKNAKLKTLLVQ